VRAACLAAALLLAACGGRKPPDGFVFRSLARKPTGKPVRIAHDLAVGEGVRLHLSMDGLLEMSGPGARNAPLSLAAEVTLRCREVRDDGSRVLELTYKPTAEATTLASQPGRGGGGTLVLAADGRVHPIKLHGFGAGILAPGARVPHGCALQLLMPVPRAGLRVGEVLDLATVAGSRALGALFPSVAPRLPRPPGVQAEYALRGVRTVDGQDAAEFAANMVTNLDTRGRTQGIATRLTARIAGTQLVSLRTGLPVGTGTMTYEMHMTMTESDQVVTMRARMTYRLRSEPL
jgi:hypothetical protein